MRLRPITVGILFLVSSGCASISDVDTALKEPAAAAKSAAEIATQSEQDVLKLVALGSARYEGSLDLATLICNPASGPDVAISNLTTFSSALATIDDVAKKPKDTSYGALLGKIGEDDKAAAKNYEEDRRKSVKTRDQDRERCVQLFSADVDPTTLVHVPPAGEGAAAIAGATATFAAIDSLLKTILGAYEEAKREAAIKAAITHLLPQMQDAVTSLEAPRNDAFGAQVVYQMSGAAEQMDRTAFGATITLHRWWTAMSIMGRWNELAPCRDFSHMTDCVKNPRMQAAANDLAAGVFQYRSLAKIDTDKVIDALQKGVDRTKSSLDGKSIKDIFDGLSEIGGALGDVGKSYSAYEKARG
jgi:hypothetical protein